MLLGHITHVEIQRNLGNSQQTVVNSGGFLAKIMTVICKNGMLLECSYDTLEVWNLSRTYVGKCPKGNFPLFFFLFN